ncbi:MAG TPA: hypothetical protein PLX89_05775 [Verrucomicrobiota bacterium]|nr:hypothetical protein [Verrucomicrobiota bacterium]
MNPNPQRFTVQALVVAGAMLVMLALTSYRFFRGSRDWGFFIGVSAIAGFVSLRALSSRRMRLDEVHTLVGRPRLTVGGAGLLTMVASAVYGGIAIYRRFIQ